MIWEKFQISPHDRFEEIWNLTCFLLQNLCFAIYAVLSRNLFYSDLRAFAWRKIEPKLNDKCQVCASSGRVSRQPPWEIKWDGIMKGQPLVFFSFVFQMEKCPTNQTEMGSDYERPAFRFRFICSKGKCTTKMKCGIWSLRLVMQGHRGIQFFSFKHGPSF